jgi:hypothetical protein
MKIFVMITAAALLSGFSSGVLAQGQQDHEQHHPTSPPTQAQPAQPPGQTTPGGGQMPMGQMHMMHQMMQDQRGGAVQEHRSLMGGVSGGVMGAPVLMRMIFSLMDADGDGAVSLDEFKAAHERIFKGMDADRNGLLTLDEMLTFMRGEGRPARP